MSLTSASLQAQADELYAVTALLALNMAPRGLDAADLIALARLEGKEAVRAVAGALGSPAQGMDECHICGEAGQLSISGAPEPDELAFTAACALDFARKHVRIHRGGWTCGRCRALSGSLPRLLQLAATALTGLQHGSNERHQLLQELFLHLAAVNGAEAHITGNPDALAVWAQELLSRAYALQVVASSIRGWQLVGPTGTPITRGAPGTALQLLQDLLAESWARAQQTGPKQQHSQASVPKRKREQQGEDQGAVMEAAEAKQQKPKRVLKAAPATPQTAVRSSEKPQVAAQISIGTNGHTPSSIANGVLNADAAASARSSTPGKKKKLRGPVMLPDAEPRATPAAAKQDASSSKKARRQHAEGGSNGDASAAGLHTPAVPSKRQHQQREAPMTAVKAKPKGKGDGKRRKSM